MDLIDKEFLNHFYVFCLTVSLPSCRDWSNWHLTNHRSSRIVSSGLASNHSEIAAVLQPWCCNRGAATAVLQPYHGNGRTRSLTGSRIQLLRKET